MDNNNSDILKIKKSRKRQIKILTKLRDLLVDAEWNMLCEANSKNDNISLVASKTVSEASKNIQLAISQLILTEFSSLKQIKNQKKGDEVISSLKKVVISK